MSMSKAAKQRKKLQRETGRDVTIKRGDWNGVNPCQTYIPHSVKRKEPLPYSDDDRGNGLIIA